MALYDPYGPGPPKSASDRRCSKKKSDEAEPPPACNEVALVHAVKQLTGGHLCELVVFFAAQLLYARVQISCPLDELRQQFFVDADACSDALDARRLKRKIKSLQKSLQPLDAMFALVRQVLMEGARVQRVAFVLGSTLITPKQMFIWHVEHDEYQQLDEQSVSACFRSFMRSLMTSGCDIYGGPSTCTSFFLLLQAEQGLWAEGLQVKHKFSHKPKKINAVVMQLQGKERPTPDPEFSRENLVWYQCGAPFHGFRYET